MYISAAEMCIPAREMYISHREMKFSGYFSPLFKRGNGFSCRIFSFSSLYVGGDGKVSALWPGREVTT